MVKGQGGGASREPKSMEGIPEAQLNGREIKKIISEQNPKAVLPTFKNGRPREVSVSVMALHTTQRRMRHRHERQTDRQPCLSYRPVARKGLAVAVAHLQRAKQVANKRTEADMRGLERPA